MPLIIEYHEELEISLLPHHDLLDFWRGTMTPRRLALLIHHLPADSAFFTAIWPDDAFIASWKPTDYLIAELWDLLLAVNWQEKNQKPSWYPRPADLVAKRAREKSRMAAFEAQLARNEQRRNDEERG